MKDVTAANIDADYFTSANFFINADRPSEWLRVSGGSVLLVFQNEHMMLLVNGRASGRVDGHFCYWPHYMFIFTEVSHPFKLIMQTGFKRHSAAWITSMPYSLWQLLLWLLADLEREGEILSAHSCFMFVDVICFHVSFVPSLIHY